MYLNGKLAVRGNSDDLKGEVYIMASPEGGNPPVNGQVARIEIENTDVFEEYREEEYRDTDEKKKRVKRKKKRDRRKKKRDRRKKKRVRRKKKNVRRKKKRQETEGQEEAEESIGIRTYKEMSHYIILSFILVTDTNLEESVLLPPSESSGSCRQSSSDLRVRQPSNELGIHNDGLHYILYFDTDHNMSQWY